MPLLSFPFVLHHLELSNEQEVRSTGRSSGLLHTVRVLLTFFDFFTTSYLSAGVAVAPRSMKLTVDSNFLHLSELLLNVHFGVKHASVIKETWVMRMLRPSRNDMSIHDMLNDILNRRSQLHKQLIFLNKVLFREEERELPDDRIENIFLAAAVCLWTKDYQPPEPIVQKLTALLDYAEFDDVVRASIDEGIFKARPDTAKFEILGMELYECAVQTTLNLISSSFSSRGQGSAPFAAKDKTFNIVEVPFCSPLAFTTPGTQATVYPPVPSNLSLSASVNEAIRVKMAQLVTEWRCREHLNWDEHPYAHLEADTEEYLRAIFDQCDVNKDDRLNKRVLLSMADNPELAAFFKIPFGCDPEMFFKDLNEREGAEVTTWDDFKEFYVSKCVDNLSACSDEKAQWTQLTRKAFAEATAANETVQMGMISPGGSGLDRWMRVLKKSKEDTLREEKEYAHSFTTIIGQHLRQALTMSFGANTAIRGRRCNMVTIPMRNPLLHLTT